MAILRLIQEWRDRQTDVELLIDKIEMHETVSRFSGCITPKFYMVVDRLRESVTFAAHMGVETVMVSVSDLRALLTEFFRLDKELRRLKPHIHVSKSVD